MYTAGPIINRSTARSSNNVHSHYRKHYRYHDDVLFLSQEESTRPPLTYLELLMKLLKYSCAILALVYLATALVPSHFMLVQHTKIESIIPEWIARAISISYSVLLFAIFYGLQKRIPIYWILVPILLGLFILGLLIPAFWSLFRLSQPWIPFIFVIVFISIGFLVFIAWWRKQRSYFA